MNCYALSRLIDGLVEQQKLLLLTSLVLILMFFFDIGREGLWNLDFGLIAGFSRKTVGGILITF